MGNGTESTYAYDRQRERLQGMLLTANGDGIMQTQYKYDPVDNILGISNVITPKAPKKPKGSEGRAVWIALTIYPAPILSVTRQRFTKHYFIGDRRVASKIGAGIFQNAYGHGANVVTAGQKDYQMRMMQIEKQREDYYRKLGTPPGVPTMKGATAEPENTHEGYNTIIKDLGDHSVPDGWIQRPKRNAVPGTPPGPPVQWDKAEDPDDVQPGYGYVPADTANHEDIFYYHSDHLGSTSYITDAKANVAQFDAYLPYGELLVDEHSSTEEMPYKFNGKELDEETGLYYYGARYMNPRTSLWYGVDPLAEKYPSVGAYVYCVGNPIKYIDPSGTKIDPGSQEEWGRQKGKVINERDRLQRKLGSLNEQATTKGWSAEKLARKIGDIQDRVNSLNGTIDNLGMLEASSQVYALKAVVGEEGGTTYDPQTGNIVFSYNGTANFVHETTHGGQFESGDIAYNTITGQPFGGDIFDEIAAYKAQYGYSPSSVSQLTSSSAIKSLEDITVSWVQGITKSDGSKIYAPSGSANTGVSPVNINTNRDGLIKAYPHLRNTLLSLPSSFTLKDIGTIHYKKR